MAQNRLIQALNNNELFLTYTGMETDLIFTQGIDLPGFAAYPLLETPQGRAQIRRYYDDLIEVGSKVNAGVILESATWVANRDRGVLLGHAPELLKERNIQSIELMAQARAENPDVPIILSANIGPRSDAYAPTGQMSAQSAADYHAEQIAVFAGTEIDLIAGYTLADQDEATGIVQAAMRFDMQVVIAFTVETDGRLPTGMPLNEAIEAVDASTQGYATYFMVNCAHPEHIARAFDGGDWMARLKGVVANASRCSHAELDEATVLDDGNPQELGQQLADLHRRYPQINVLGGCCGTDMRHMTCIAQSMAR